MKVLDFHSHIFPDELAKRAISTLMSCSPESKNHTDGTMSGLLESMHKNGINKSVLLPVATKPSQVPVINQNCLNLKSNEHIPFGALHPDTDNIEQEISFLKSNHIAGIKFHPEYQNFYIEDKSLFPIYEQLSSANLIVVFHAGKDPGPFTCDHALPSSLKIIHKNFPDLKIVAAHLGGWKLWDEVENNICGLPIYLDTSAISEYIQMDQFLRIVRKHGIEHILFGTDSPWFDQGTVKQWIENSKLTDNEKELILWENGFRLLTE